MTSTRVLVLTRVGAFGIVMGISGYLAWGLDNAPDEGSHLTMVEHHADNLALIEWQELRYGSQRGHAYNLFSPVPYAPYVPFEWVDELGEFNGAGRPDRFVTRLGGLALAAAQLAVTIALVRRLCRRCSELEVTAIALAANLIPQLRYIHAYVNTDAMTILAATLSFALALRVLQSERVTLTDAALVGLTVGLVAHMRYNGFVAGAVLLVAFAVRAVRQDATTRTRFRLVGVTVALPVLLAGSFHLYVYDELRNGHVLATIDNEQLTSSTFQGEIPETKPVPGTVRVRLTRGTPSVWMGMWAWFVGVLELRGPVLALLLALSLVGGAGLLLPGDRFTTAGRWIGIIACVAFLASWLSMAAQPLVSQQGRFLLPAAVTALAAIVVGTAAVLDWVPRLVHRAFLGAAVWGGTLLAINAWAMLRVGT